MKMGMKRSLCGGYGMCKGFVVGVGMVRVRLKEGLSDWSVGSR